jgi:hypothetical protein
VTGYLQRLAVGAAGSGGTIRPVLPPLYANLLTDIGSALPELELGDPPSTIARSDPHIRPERATPARSPESEITRMVPPRANLRAAMPWTLDEAARVLGPPGDPAASDVQPPGDAHLDGVRAAPFVSALISVERQMPEAPLPSDDRPEDTRSEPFFAPLLVAPAPVDMAADRLAAARLHPAAAARGVRHAGMAYAGAHSVEPNDIAIHIGRVEVTAVQPAPIPAPPKPPRHAPSLDEYLKRRNGGRS